ncbi:hypothetical protein J7K06_04650 [Candidatus Bathyarchaeota archaeon]|nr:hypothetical protein [Candidatus Bathyarchaeota archaeon]
MKLSEQRIMASLLLLLGFSFLLIALYSGQLDYILNLIKSALKAAIIGS